MRMRAWVFWVAGSRLWRAQATAADGKAVGGDGRLAPRVDASWPACQPTWLVWLNRQDNNDHIWVNQRHRCGGG